MVFPCFLSWLSLEICVNIADWWLYCLVPANYVNWRLLMERSFWSAESIEGGILGCWLTLTWKGEALTSGSLGQIAKTLFKYPWGGVCHGGGEGLGLSNSTVIVSFPKTSIDAPPHCPVSGPPPPSQLLSWFHSADPPSLPLESMMDWLETKPSRSQTERFLFTFGNNLKPLEKIMCQLCINSFTTR